MADAILDARLTLSDNATGAQDDFVELDEQPAEEAADAAEAQVAESTEAAAEVEEASAAEGTANDA